MRFAKGHTTLSDHDRKIIEDFAAELAARPDPAPPPPLQINAHQIRDAAMAALQEGAPGLSQVMKDVLATKIANNCIRAARGRS